MADIDKLSDRLSVVERDVAVIKERITHMPTKLEVQQIVGGAQSKIIWAIALFAVAAAVKWAWPVLFGQAVVS